jgi:hypothetical protein
MFSRIAPISLFALLISLIVLAQAQTVPGQQAQSGKTSIIIDRQRLRFVAPSEALEWRLEVSNQQGEVIFDSGLVYSTALEWPLSNQQGEAVTSGLYTYKLSLKEPTSDSPRLQRGHVIVDRPSLAERIWVTNEQSASLGAANTEVKLTVVSTVETTLGGAEFPGGVPQRAANAEQGEAPKRSNAEPSAEKAAGPSVVNGTANQVVKFAPDGANLVDSGITEVSGNVGIGTATPQSGLDYRSGLAPFFTRDIGTTNFGTPQSALQLGVSNAGSRFAGVGPSMLFFADNSNGAKSFLGRVSGAWENPTAGAEAGALLFQTRANSGDIGASTERMRITAGGNVGIGTTNPSRPLTIRGSSAAEELISFEDTNGQVRWHINQNLGGNNRGLNFVETGVADGRLFLRAGGNVGIGTVNPNTAYKLHAEAAASGTFARSGVLGTGINGVYGHSTSATINGAGVLGQSENPNGWGVYGYNVNGHAGYFAGNVTVQGTLSKSAGSFKIDHPLDPANKYLSHSFVESPEMMNIYNGNITTDERGEAEVTLPDYFSALNRDFRYQLTVLGQFAQAIVASKIKDNRFMIKTDKPNVEVSWQVTGVRQDAYAQAHPIKVEEEKPERERGHYLYPKLHGQPEALSVEWARSPELMRQMKQRREQAQQKPPQEEP